MPQELAAPAQLLNVELESGIAVKATVVPMLNGAVHVGRHFIPAGLLVTVPEPVPCNWTLRFDWLALAKTAVTDWLEFIAIMQSPVPTQLDWPFQPANV